jgi:hypothetical protein
MHKIHSILILGLILTIAGCKSGLQPVSTLRATEPPASSAQEIAITPIPIAGPLSGARAEISGMAWYGDHLILLPQYPSRFGDQEDGAVFTLDKADILDFLNGNGPQVLQPQEIPFSAPGLTGKISGFQGFEALAFSGDQAFLAIEAKPGRDMMGYLVTGSMAPDLSELRLDTTRLAEITTQAHLDNMAYETLIIAGDQVAAIYEANGRNVNPAPEARMYGVTLQPQDPISFPNIEYRITDATALDGSRRFWAINYFFPGDTLLRPAADPLAEKYGQGLTHARFKTVERLVQFQFDETGISLVSMPPIQLQLVDDDHSRNWEALARLEGRGFLLATDQYPETIFAFIPYP